MDRLTGGKLYDKGGYGCIFIPPLTCKTGTEVGDSIGDSTGDITGDSTGTIPGNILIDKLMPVADAIDEYSIAEKIRSIPLWKNYFIVSLTMCTPAPRIKQTETTLSDCDILSKGRLDGYRLLRMPFGGKPLSHINIKFNGESMYEFILHIMESAALMQLFGVVHRDLHQGNILVDNQNVPRIIDFNLSISVKGSISIQDILHRVDIGLSHEPPDSCIVNAISQGEKGLRVISELLKGRTSLQKIQALLGVRMDTMHEQLEEFYRQSKSAQAGDYIKWFQLYWPTIDSWAVGIMIVQLLTHNMLWKSFMDVDFKGYAVKLFGILRDMLNMNPMKRIDCVQALARLDADNYIIRKYAKQWLIKRPIS